MLGLPWPDPTLHSPGSHLVMGEGVLEVVDDADGDLMKDVAEDIRCHAKPRARPYHGRRR